MEQSNNILIRLKNSLLWSLVLAMVVALLLPLTNINRPVNAGTLGNRSVLMSSSLVSATGVTYTVEVDLAASQTLGGMVIEMCSNSPLVNTACTAPTGFSWTAGPATLGSVTGWTGAVIDGATNANKLVLTDAAPDAGATGTIVIPVNAVVNSSTLGTFYARVVTYATVVGATGHTSANINAGAAHTDNGGVALSTANQITITALVQEILTFCVATSIAGDYCDTPTGTAIDLGVLGFNAVNTGNVTAKIQLTTNAAGGVVVTYLGDNLKVTGASCGTTDIEATPSTTDQCINRDTNPYAGTFTTITAGTEQWGIAVTAHTNRIGGQTTDAFDPTAAYAYTIANRYAFVPNDPTTIATSAGPVDSETLEVQVAGTVSIVTPTGVYQTSLMFVATGTF